MSAVLPSRLSPSRSMSGELLLGGNSTLTKVRRKVDLPKKSMKEKFSPACNRPVGYRRQHMGICKLRLVYIASTCARQYYTYAHARGEVLYTLALPALPAKRAMQVIHVKRINASD